MSRYSAFRVALISILLLSIPSAYSMWGDRLEIAAKIRTAQAIIHITSYKAQGFEGYNVNGKCIAGDGAVAISGDGRRAVVSFTNISQGWFAWVGLVISNNGEFPKRVAKPSTALPINFTASSFLYGPYRSPGDSGVWGSLDICELRARVQGSGNPFPGSPDNNLVDLYPGYKAIAWIFINYTGSEPVPMVSIAIEVPVL